MGRKPLSYEYVKEVVEKEGCELISETYEGAHSPLKIRCRCKNVFEVSFVNFEHHNQRQCLECSGRHSTDKLSFEYVKEVVENEGCKLISEEYINNHTPLKIQCKCKNVFEVSFNNFKDGQRQCKECSGGYSSSYNPNLSEEYRIKHRSIEGYSTFKTTVRNTFDKCICCGSEKDLCTHHIYNYNDYEEYRTNPLNGIVFCKECHKEYHSKYGIKENNFEQFREFCFNKYKETNDIKWLVAIETVDCRIYKLQKSV